MINLLVMMELTKEFYETFRQNLQAPLLESIQHSYLIDKLTVSQNQAVIKLSDLLKTGVPFLYSIWMLN